MGRTKYIGEILVEEGLIAPEQLREALAAQKKQLGQILIEKGFIKPEDVDRALQLQVGIARSETYARYFRAVLVVALLVTAMLGYEFYTVNRRAQFLERLGEGRLTLAEVHDVLLSEGSTYKMEALRSLERYTPAEREELLSAALRSDLWYLRLYAALFVQTRANVALLPNLIPLTMTDEPPVVRFAAGEALQRLTGENHGSDFQAWFNYAKGKGIKPVFPERLLKATGPAEP